MFNIVRIRKIGELHPVQIIVLSFLSAILLGTFLLMLPQASTGEPLGFVNALFEATSAVCVTGLIGGKSLDYAECAGPYPLDGWT